MTVALAPLGFVSMFSVFHAYDDEGYFLVTLRDYLNGHADYTQIYGPFYYELVGGVFRVFGLDVSTDHGRIVTLIVWLLGSLIGGITIITLTRNVWLGVAGQFLTFHVLSVLANEPMHASALIALLLLSLAAVVANWFRLQRTAPVLVGSLVAAITLVKINVGAYTALPVCLAFAAALPGRWRRAVLPATGVVLVAAPLVVTSGLFGLEWVRELAVVVSLSAAAVAVAASPGEATNMRRADVLRLIAGGAAVMIGCLGIASAGGLRLSDLVASVVTASKFPGLFVIPVQVGIYGVIWAALSLAVAGGLAWRRPWPRVSPVVPALLRIAVGAFTLGSLLLLPAPLFLLSLPLAWVAMLRPANGNDSSADPTARVLLAGLAVMSILQAYPVAGTQKWIAALMVVPAGAIIFDDGLRQFQTWAAARHRRSLMAASWLAPAALIVNIPVALLFGFVAVSDYTAGQSPGLPGTELLRLPPTQAASLRSLAREIDSDCGEFITMPRLPSLYLWTGRQGVSQLNHGIWEFMDASQQEAIVAQIRDKPRLCVVRNQAVLEFEAQSRPIPRRPLVEFIDTQFEPAASFGDYELLIRKT